MTRFSGREDQGYKNVSQELRKWVDTIKTGLERTETGMTGLSLTATVSLPLNQSDDEINGLKVLKEPHSEDPGAIVE
jgi:hypothetical protein